MLAGLVVAELLGHADRHGQKGVPLLEPVGGPKDPLDASTHHPVRAAVREDVSGCCAGCR